MMPMVGMGSTCKWRGTICFYWMCKQGYLMIVGWVFWGCWWRVRVSWLLACLPLHHSFHLPVFRLIIPSFVSSSHLLSCHPIVSLIIWSFISSSCHCGVYLAHLVCLLYFPLCHNNISLTIIIHRWYSSIQVTRCLAIDIHLGFTLTNPTWCYVPWHSLG